MPKSLHKSSHPKTNVLVKFDIAKIGVVHMASFKVEKAYSTASFYTKSSFFRKGHSFLVSIRNPIIFSKF